MTRRELFSIIPVPFLIKRSPKTLSFTVPIYNLHKRRNDGFTIAQVKVTDTATCQNCRRAFGPPLEERYPEYERMKLWAEAKRLSL